MTRRTPAQCVGMRISWQMQPAYMRIQSADLAMILLKAQCPEPEYKEEK